MEVIGDNYIYQIDMKGHARAMTMPCADGNTIYIDINLSEEQKLKEYYHEDDHIKNNDRDAISVQLIEKERHENGKG